MTRRIIVVAIVVAACLLVVAPAFGFNGMRGDYTTTEACQSCHSGTPGIPPVYNDWKWTKHAIDAEGPSSALSLPYGSVCAGCHTANYDPGKVTPSPSGTSWVADPSVTTLPQADPSAVAPFSEPMIGCSSCHYGADVVGGLTPYGVDTNNTAHKAPYGLMANADICGACHSRYSYAVVPIAVTPVPGAGTPTPLIQPQMALGYHMLGSPAPSPSTGWNPAAPLSAYLNIPHPGWSPSPTATPTGLGKLQTYWRIPDPTSTVPGATIDSVWQQTGHDGSAAQYPEWASEGPADGLSHAKALESLTSQFFWQFLDETTKQSCLECHSADFRIMKEAGKAVTSADVQYGITCVGCHKPHTAGTAKGAWDEGFDTQLITDSAKTLCVTCHNGEIPAGTTASPGAEVHHPMKEMMDGYGAIDVAAFPSVHKGKCVQCHMPPTSYSRGSVQLGGNHTFNIIDPATAVDASPIPFVSTTVKATATPSGSPTAVVTTTVTTTQDTMPYSACSTCHDNNVKATPQPVSSVTTTPSPTASPIQVRVDVLQNKAGGDKGLWLQDTIDQRQEWTHAKVDEIHAALEAAAGRLGYTAAVGPPPKTATTVAWEALVAIPAASRTASETNFLKAFTNVGYVESEGSFGIHNWDYSRAIVNTALVEVNSVEATPAPTPWTVSFKASKTSVKKNTTIKYSGTVAPSASLAWGGAKVNIQRKVSGVWQAWKNATCNGSGAYSLSVKMASKGTYYLRASMPANSKQLVGSSAQIKVVVK